MEITRKGEKGSLILLFKDLPYGTVFKPPGSECLTMKISMMWQPADDFYNAVTLHNGSSVWLDSNDPITLVPGAFVEE